MNLAERIRLLGVLIGEFTGYLRELAEYDAKSFPEGVTRTDDALMVDFGYYLIRPDKEERQ
jgi:hypothetical protein